MGVRKMQVEGWSAPETRASAGAARQVAEELRQQPDVWAIIEEYVVPVAEEGASEEEETAVKDQARRVRAKASSRASLIKQGRVAAFRSLKTPTHEGGWPGTFEAVSRTAVDKAGRKVIRVFAKYRGEDFAVEPPAKTDSAAKKASPVTDGSGPTEAEVESAVPVEDTVSV